MFAEQPTHCNNQCINCPLSKLEPSRVGPVSLTVSDMMFVSSVVGIIPPEWPEEFAENLEVVTTDAVKAGERGLDVDELKIAIEAYKTICSNNCEFVEI